MKLYGIPNCSTVKKAREWLAQHDVPYAFHDFKKQGFEQAVAQQWLEQVPWEKLVNRAGMTWRNLSETEKAAVSNAQAALTLMQSNTSVIKRPVVVKDHQIIAIGFNEAEYTQLFQKQ
ncbi:ArsC family reductase [Methylophilus aquaticus]|uniref:ArsC family reductase n=1 Tax=Methylophilus aquaticus TaxID=1971610 RepID=A0ABT9JSQ9_9PROT|nr:ArsC family reductase [Methylophilus aquaticus]MDP8567602.1 ArsC family reductase [Methylophilus aquaticus]